MPNPFIAPHQKSAFESVEFVNNAVTELLGNGCLEQCTDVPLVCSPLLVVTSRSGKKRLVINLKYVNNFLYKERLKYEDMRTAMQLFKKGTIILRLLLI